MMQWLLSPISVLILLLLSLSRRASAAHQQYQGDRCASDGSTCVLFNNCALAQGDLKDGKRPPLCGFEEAEPVVCCTLQLANRFGESAKSISQHMCTKYEEESCGSTNNTERTNEPMTYMAMIGYGPRSNISWLCTGTLISRRYILSAAHCAKTQSGTASWVSLGHRDPKGKSIYSIKVNFQHYDYQSPKLYNDIALYRLNKIVEFGTYIRPICLPSPVADELEFSRIAVSVGFTRLADKEFISYNDSIRLVPNYRCGLAGTPEELPNGPKENILCASQLSHDNSCVKSLYGGVLISPFTPIPTDYNSPQCYLEKQLGLLAVGQMCGIAEYPGVYMNLTHFLPWIESVVWPENSPYTEIIWHN